MLYIKVHLNFQRETVNTADFDDFIDIKKLKESKTHKTRGKTD